MKLIILTASRTGPASDCVKTLAGAGCKIVRVVLTHGVVANRARLCKRRLQKIREIGILGAANGIRMRAWYRPPPGDDLQALCEQGNIPFSETETTNGPDTERLFRQADADLGLSLGNSYISERIFSIPRFGMVNFHGEILPRYQNAQSVIWPIYHMEVETGLTIHQIDKGIDTGGILYQEIYPIVLRPTLRETVMATNAVTRERAPRAVARVCQAYPDFAARILAQVPGPKYTTPSLRQFLRMVRNHRLLYRQVGGQAV